MTRKLCLDKRKNNGWFQKGHISYNIKNEIGNKYGKLTVIEKKENNKFGTTRWLCKCDCGNLTVTNGLTLRNGKTKSCGCIITGKQRKGEQPLKRMFRSYKTGATNRNLKFELSFIDFKNTVMKECFYCGDKPYREHYAFHRTRYSKGKQTDEVMKFNGIDRLDSNVGYILNNCVSCCIYCNRAKSDLNVEEFKIRILKIYERFVK